MKLKIKSKQSKKILSRKILNNKKTSVKIEESNQVNPLHHKNIHFNESYEKEKRNLFLS